MEWLGFALTVSSAAVSVGVIEWLGHRRPLASEASRMSYRALDRDGDVAIICVDSRWWGLAGWTVRVHRIGGVVPVAPCRFEIDSPPPLEIRFRTLKELQLKLDVLA